MVSIECMSHQPHSRSANIKALFLKQFNNLQFELTTQFKMSKK